MRFNLIDAAIIIGGAFLMEIALRQMFWRGYFKAIHDQHSAILNFIERIYNQGNNTDEPTEIIN